MRDILAFGLLCALATPGLAQQAVRDDGKTFATDAARAAADLAGDEATATANLPNYNGANAGETRFADNPEALEAARITAARTNEAAVLVVDGDKVRLKVPKSQVDETVARGEAINLDPSTFVQGVDPSGTTGQCVELPPSQSSPGVFEATCNAGARLVDEAKVCTIPLEAKLDTKTITNFDYWVAGDGVYGAPFVRDQYFAGQLASGQCKVMPERIGGCEASRAVGLNPNKFCGDYTLRHLQCSAAITPEAINGGIPGTGAYVMPTTGHWYYATSTSTVETVTTSRNEAVCNEMAADQGCTPVGGEVCIDNSPVTRTIGNTQVTQPCWAWQRSFQCQTVTRGYDCTDLDKNPACHFNRTECLDDPQVGACKVEERIYTCPIPGSVNTPRQAVCGGDVYCIGGDCEAVTREASNEFKDAVVGLNTLVQARNEFDEMDFKLFKGDQMGCHKPIFGLVNCCAGKTSGLITTAAGAAALVAGPAAIAGLATPFLALFLCSPKEMELDVRDRMGLCHTLGSYCSEKVLGVCTTKRKTSCCFLSKLTRILQEQGRVQLNKNWGTPKSPDCSGYTIEEFAQLDLSKMDFTEVYQEFIDAAKLPNEAATMTDIQTKIQNYYSRGGS
jgi:conjugal transfer mating pair stabilization protein TraN